MAAAISFAAGAVKEDIFWRWWEASGSQLMLLGLAMMALAGFLRPR